MIKITCRVVIVFVLIALNGFVNAQSKNVIKLKSGEYELNPNIDKIKMSDFESMKYEDSYFLYVHFEKIPTDAVKATLKNNGVELLEYVPNNSFMVKVSASVQIQDLKQYAIDGVYLILPEFKMSNDVAFQNYPLHALNGDKIKLVVQNFASASSSEMENYYGILGGIVISRYAYSNLTTIEIPISNIQKLASHPLVKYIEPIDPPAEHEDIVGQSNHRSNYISNPTLNPVSYNGLGVWLAIGDDGELGPHIDYTGRMDQTSVGPSSGSHGDHVSGIMMGAGNLDPMGRGMAWGADIKVYDVWDAVNSTPVSYFNPGVVVTSTSYGNGCNAGYTSFAQTADQQIRQMPNLMHVFSAGNSGTSNCGYGAGSGWGNITGGIKAGKNVLAVGNVTYLDVLAGSSSRGPASDGRIKPDICANGTQVYSCQPNNTYANLTGTSMAAPGVSGTYGQLVHAYRSLNGGVTPSSALVKGTMLNTADDLGNVGPDFKYGWGRLNARRVVKVFENNTFLEDSISQGATKNHVINVPSGTEQVKIMVYWNDFEGSTVTTTALVNNLDMLVADPSSMNFQPYILDPTPNATTLDLPATNGIDNLNNMEQVVIDNPTAGNHTVTINGTSIPQGPQKYFLIYEFISNEIIVTYPTGGEGLEPGTSETIRWDAVVGTNPFTLEYSINNGGTWTTINNSVPASSRSYNWGVPNVVSGAALIRVTRNSVSGTSSMPFSIIGVPNNILVSTSCPNSFELTWDSVPGATAYEVSVLGAEYMDSVATVNTMNALLTGYSSSNSYWVSVKAKTSDAIGKRAIAIQKQPGIWGCILPNDIEVALLNPFGNSFFDCADNANKNVTVRLKNIGTNSVTNVDLAYKFNSATTVTGQYVGTLLPGDSTDFAFTQTISFNSPGNYNLDVWKTTIDDNPSNDSVLNPFQVYTSTTIQLPYEQNFETFSNCPTTSNCGGTSCNLTDGWRNLTNGSWDDVDFRVNNGSTPSQNTGPNTDHNPGTSSGKYLYLEASGGCEYSEGQVISPCIDLTNGIEPHATIWYHMLGSDLGELHFDVLFNGKWYNDVVPAEVGNHGGLWQIKDINLSTFVGSKINIRYRGIIGFGWGSDIALDDFKVYESILNAAIVADTLPCILSGPVNIAHGPSGAASSYLWDFGVGANPATANTEGPHSVVYPGIGPRTIQLIVSDGLVSDTAYKIIELVGMGIPSFTALYNVNSDSMEFTNTSTDFASVHWDFGDGNSSVDINPIHKYSSKGYYDVILTLTNSCGDTSITQKVENFPLGINTLNNQKNAAISVYPNPGNGELAIQFAQFQNVDGNVILFDLNGRTVFEKEVKINSQNQIVNINLQHLAKGIYLMQFESEVTSHILKIIIQ